jgi:FMN phosphatase YigB (HAD superfamily)
MNDPIDAVIFDVGKVLLDFDWNLALEKIAARSPLTSTQIVEQVTNDGDLIDYETGKITSTDFFQRQKKAFQYGGSWEELAASWCAIFTPLENNFALARQLAARCHLGLLSNTNEAHVDYFEPKYDFPALFPVRIYSCRVGYMKPRREIYETMTKQLGVAPERTVFIDDLEANTLAAAELGWKTVHYRPGLDLPAALRQLGLSQ